MKLSDFTLAQSEDDSTKQMQYDFKMAARLAFGERSLEESRTSLPRSAGPSHHQASLDSIPSPFYAAPELFGGGKFSSASDLWSMGVIAYELFAGKTPHNYVYNIICSYIQSHLIENFTTPHLVIAFCGFPLHACWATAC